MVSGDTLWVWHLPAFVRPLSFFTAGPVSHVATLLIAV